MSYLNESFVVFLVLRDVTVDEHPFVVVSGVQVSHQLLLTVLKEGEIALKRLHDVHFGLVVTVSQQAWS